MVMALACEALRDQKRIALHYDGHDRVVEVHAVGVTRDNNGVLRVFQVRGGSNSNTPVGWKLFRADQVSGAHMVDERSEAPRPQYKRGDSAMQTINCQV